MEAIVKYCAEEVTRQGDTPLHVYYMVRAWGYAKETTPTDVTEFDIIMLGDMVNGEHRHQGWRKTPVFFRDGSLGADWWMVPHLMTRLLSFQNDATPDEFVKQFLDIHPFEDGNGRVASLLRNALMQTLDDPNPLPYYYGKDSG